MQKQTSAYLLGVGLAGYAVATFCLVVFLSSYFHTTPVTSVLDDELQSTTLLPDFKSITITKTRKEEFLGLLRPLIEEKNQKLLKSRERLLKLKAEFDQTGELTGVNKRNFEVMRRKFNVSEETYPEMERAIAVLLLRVDEIPAAMVLAQAAAESGWGTSRFAEEAHNLFGQWCYTPGCGIIPKRRAANAKHEVQKFSSVEESITAYYRNINTHSAYRAWRQMRANLRKQPDQFTGANMVAALDKYSERGEAYIAELRTLIRSNKLE
ncbi:MAG: glucosaminidase domain-containing protein [Cellvibrio sp.]